MWRGGNAVVSTSLTGEFRWAQLGGHSGLTGPTALRGTSAISPPQLRAPQPPHVPVAPGSPRPHPAVVSPKNP